MTVLLLRGGLYGPGEVATSLREGGSPIYRDWRWLSQQWRRQHTSPASCEKSPASGQGFNGSEVVKRSPSLRVVPIVNFFAGLVLGVAVPLLYFSF